MIDHLHVYNISIKTEEHANAYWPQSLPGCFELKTCQRLLVVSNGPVASASKPFLKKAQVYHGPNGYHYLLEVLCGLQSQMLGENEIVSQFKTALHQYLEQPVRYRCVIIMLEKLLKDAKEIRTNYLSHVGKSSYAAVAKKIFGRQTLGKPVLIIGTGHLAQDLLQYFRKNHPLTLCARNKERLDDWHQKAPFETIPWLDTKRVMEFPLILNTVGVPQYKMFNQDFLSSWEKLHQGDGNRCFIDFGSPSSIDMPSPMDHFYRLQDLFTHGAILDSQKFEKIEQAKRDIEQISLKRTLWLDNKMSRDQKFALTH